MDELWVQEEEESSFFHTLIRTTWISSFHAVEDHPNVIPRLGLLDLEAELRSYRNLCFFPNEYKKVATRGEKAHAQVCVHVV